MSENPNNVDQISEDDHTLPSILLSGNSVDSQSISSDSLSPIVESIDPVNPVDPVNSFNSVEQLVIFNLSEENLPEPENRENLDHQTDLVENTENQAGENEEIITNDLTDNLAKNNFLAGQGVSILNLLDPDTKSLDQDYLSDSSAQSNMGLCSDMNTVTMEMIYAKLLQIESEISQLKNDVTSLKNLPKFNDSKTESKKAKKPDFTEIFNPLKFLREYGQDNLKNQLDKMTNDELKEIIRSYNIKKAKEMKGLERSQMILDIIQYAGRELNRGGVFLQDR